MLKFFLLAAVFGTLAAQDQTLIGGRPVPSGAFDPVVYISMGNGRCSATIVGERVLLTAAHCARSNQQVSFQHNRNRYTARCTGHPSYPRQDLDVSLCIIDKPVVGVKAASIDFRGVKNGDKMTLTGYGCVTPERKGGNDGILRWGNTTVTGFTSFDIITRGGAASCMGDSGSSNYREIQDLSKHLYVVGVTSKGNIRDTSYLANLALPTYKTWMTKWEEDNKVKICGLSEVCDKEGDVEPEPQPDPEENDCRFEQKILDFFSAQTAWAQTELEKCQAK